MTEYAVITEYYGRLLLHHFNILPPLRLAPDANLHSDFAFSVSGLVSVFLSEYSPL
jgi:hypothetical protein